MRRGVTIVELLVAVGVIALLLALSVPALRGARERAVRAADLSNLRTSLQDAAAWSNDHQDRFLNDGPTQPGSYNFFIAPHGEPIAFEYLGHIGFWPEVLAKWTGERSEAWSRHGGLGTWYSMAMITDPAMWRSCPHDTYRMGRYFRFVLTSETVHPSRKAMFVNDYTVERIPERDTAMGFADGSAEGRPLGSARPGVGASCAATSYYDHYRTPGLFTPDGVLGDDVEAR